MPDQTRLVGQIRRLLVGAIVVGLEVSASCVGTVGPDKEAGPPGAGLGSATRPGGGTGAGVGPAPAGDPRAGGAASASGAVAPVPMRRLTRAEYTATVRDLLGLELGPNAQFVPDEKMRWFENDAAALTLSPVLAEQYLTSAEDLAARAVAALDKLVPCASRADDACATTFIRDIGQRAFRRPVTGDEVAALQAAYQAGKADGGFRSGVDVVLRTMLVSPPFLYRIETGEPMPGSPGAMRPTSFEMASRLSYFLWGSMPDAALFEAAAKGQLTTAAAVRAQAERMLGDPRARSTVMNVFRQWLDLDEIDKLDKLTSVFPEWRPALAPVLRKEVDAFLDDAVFGAQSTLHALYTSSKAFINRDTARLYGASGPTGTALEPAQLDASKRSGLLTLAGILAAHASNDDTSPTLRGAFVRARILCLDLPPPPPNVNNQRPPRSTTRTTRERVSQHASDPSCSSCHVLIDPIGFGFERYDGIGRYRDTENGKPIDDAGEVSGTQIGKFLGAVELAGKIAASTEAARCLADQLYRHALGRQTGAPDAAALGTLSATAAGTVAGALKRLIVSVTQSDAFLFLTKLPGGRT